AASLHLSCRREPVAREAGDSDKRTRPPGNRRPCSFRRGRRSRNDCEALRAILSWGGWSACSGALGAGLRLRSPVPPAVVGYGGLSREGLSPAKIRRRHLSRAFTSKVPDIHEYRLPPIPPRHVAGLFRCARRRGGDPAGRL